MHRVGGQGARGLAETLWEHSSEFSCWIAAMGWETRAFLHWFPFPVSWRLAWGQVSVCSWTSSTILEKGLSLVEKLQALEVRNMCLLERAFSCSHRWPQLGWDGGGREIIITCYRSLPGLYVICDSNILFSAHELLKQDLSYNYD